MPLIDGDEQVERLIELHADRFVLFDVDSRDDRLIRLASLFVHGVAIEITVVSCDEVLSAADTDDLTEVYQNHLCSFGGEASGGRTSDPSCRAGDDRYTPIELEFATCRSREIAMTGLETLRF